jgi:hypothetical protein
MFERFSRSWTLIKASAGVLAKDKELLVFPLLSGIATLLVMASFALPLIGMGVFEQLGEHRADALPVGAYVLGFLFYLVQYIVIFFFNTALVGAAMIRLRGGDPTVADGLRIAMSKLPAIFGYALIAATVGMILRALQERAGWLGRWVAGFLGMAWTVASFLVVPVLVSREVGAMDAVKESASLLRKTWGENVIDQGGIGLVFGLITFAAILLGVALVVGAAMSQSVVLIVAAVALVAIVVLSLALVQTALSGIYSAALYRHASGEGDSDGFEGALLSQAFAVKR